MISISELIDTLSDEFKEQNTNINYKALKTLRNIGAHKYGAMNSEIVWQIIIKNLPKYKVEFTSTINFQ